MKVRESGKPVYAYSDGLDRSAIFLASACDKIYVANDATVYFVGMGMVREYYKGFFDKIGVKANIHKIKDYKTAAEPYIREDMSPEAREMSKWLLDEFWDIQLTAISEGRGIEQERLVEMMDHILFTAPEAVDAGLVDEVMYWSDLVESLREGDDKSLKTVSQSEYADVSRSSLGLKGDKRIAIIHAHGTIGGRRSRLDPYLGPMIGHETVVRQLRAAADNDKIDAIVFRVDSGGGESLASGIIAHEVERVRSKKPIIASMIDVAASGGYALSYKATKIVADELTITGSIGSIYGKFTTAPMFNKIGVTFDSETKGPNALFWSTTTDFSEEQWARFTDFHFRSFNMWLSQVAEERGMEFEEAEKLAHGRVWTGRQAKENGLIDELGGLDRAIELAKEEIGLSVDEQVTLVHYPKKKGLYQLLSEGVSPMAAARWFAYKVIHEELAETARFLTNADVHVWDARVE